MEGNGKTGGRRLRGSPAGDVRGLRDEIRMLRAVIRRVGGLADEGRSMEDLLDLLDGLSAACSRLANMLRTEQFLSTQEIAGLLNQRLSGVIEDLRQERRTPPTDGGR